MPRFYRTDTVEAVQLTWDNWKEVADKVGGRFVQQMQLDKRTGVMGGVGYLLIPRVGYQAGDRRAEVGWWVVQEGDEWIGMPPDMFWTMYAPSLTESTDR